MPNHRLFTSKIRITYILLFAMMILFLLLFGTSFGVLFLFANILTVIVLLFTRNLYKVKGKRVYRTLHIVGAFAYAIFLLSFIMIEGYILYELKASQNIDEDRVDYVVILGAGLQGDELSNTLETRLEAGTEFLKQHPELPVIVSGGQGPGESMTEAEAMGDYLKEQGIAEERILYEKRSETTYQNLKFSKQLLKEKEAENDTILIVTSDYHLVRAKMISRKLELDSYGLSADSPLLVKVNYFIREYFGIVKTWVVY